MFHLLLVCIIWHIRPILWYKPFQTYLWFLTLKIYYNVYVVILVIAPKRHLKCTKIVKIMETKGNKILWNIKTRWISMISLVKRVLSKYRILFMKMALDAPIIPFAKSSLSLLIDVEFLLGLNVMMLMLEVVYSLIKFAKLRDVFVYDFIVIMKICEWDVCCIFCDKQSSFEGNVFNNFTILINTTNENINFHWITYMNIGMLLPTSQIKIPNHLNNTHYPYYYPLSKNSNAKKNLEIKKR